MTLPTDLRAAIEHLLEHRSQKDLAERAELLSERYRQNERGGARYPMHLTENDVVAYVATRMPATYAACQHVFADVALLAPGFRPSTLLDCGCGPGTALWAAKEQWVSLASARLIDSSDAFLTVGRQLAAKGADHVSAEWHLAAAPSQSIARQSAEFEESREQTDRCVD